MRRIPEIKQKVLKAGPYGEYPMMTDLGSVVEDQFTWDFLNPKDRRELFDALLGPFQNEIKVSARRNGVPPWLLATVILGEIRDLDFRDMAQARLGMEEGSFGMAQIQVKTALNNRLVDVDPSEAAREGYRIRTRTSGFSTQPVPLPLPDPRQDVNIGQRAIVTRRLKQPAYAIEAAAREISNQLDAILDNPQTSTFREIRHGKINRRVTRADRLRDPEIISRDLWSDKFTVKRRSGGQFVFPEKSRQAMVAQWVHELYNTPISFDFRAIYSQRAVQKPWD